MQFTKHLLSWLPLFLLLILATGCEREEIDVAANTDFPPSILSSYPSANGRVVAGDFDIRVVFADGTVSPLQSATVTLMDSTMNVIATQTSELSGIQDSLVIQGADFNASSLPVGIYNMTVSVTDAKAQTTEQSFTFEISNLPYPANYDAIYLAGAFNGWDPANNQLTLVGPNLWEVQGVDLQGEGWKLVDGPKFGGEDWGDPECDGFMNSSTGGNGDTACGFTGLSTVRFNDETLTYTVAANVTYASNSMSLFLLGTFNAFQGSEYQFNLVDDNTWVLDEVLLTPGDQFKMAEMPDFQGLNYGDNENDGTAEAYGSNIVVADDQQEGYYGIRFNDQSFVYELTFLRSAGPESVGIIGSATPTGWDSDTNMEETSEGIYTITMELIDGVVKFRADDAWDLSWGGTEFPTGTAVVNGGDIPVVAGTYRVTLDINNLTYSFVAETGIAAIGLIGSGSPVGWEPADGEDFNLVLNEDSGTWSAVVGLVNGDVKFRANDNWDVSWGAIDFPSGTATSDNGPNIPVTSGIYVVSFDPASGAYSFEPASIGIIGTATSGGWDSDTDLTVNPDVPGEVSLTGTFTGGVAKFRTNNDWVYNWGGTDFPAGTAVFNGGDIPVTAGEYTVKFNVNTLQYSFE